MKYYVQFNVCTGYYIEADDENMAIAKAYNFYEQYEPTITIDEPSDEECETEEFY